MWVCDYCGYENSDAYAICTNCSKDRSTHAPSPANPMPPPFQQTVAQAEKSGLPQKNLSRFGPDDRLSPLAVKLERMGTIILILSCVLAGLVLLAAAVSLLSRSGGSLGLFLVTGYVLLSGYLFQLLLHAAAVLVEASYRSMMRPSDVPVKDE